jgi:tRNA1Val (adenine37-N6)-methyltransferase
MPGPFTEDAVFRGKIKVFQPPRGRGYRFSVDSVLLGHFASRRRARSAVDLGAGCGVVGFILLHAQVARKTFFVELDPVLAEACRLGIEANGFGGRADVVEADIRQAGWRRNIGKADLVVSNPPYGKKGSGRVSASASVAAARHEVTMEVHDVLRCAPQILEPAGRLCVIVPPERLGDIFAAAGTFGMNFVRLRFVHPKPDRPAGGVLAELKPAAGRATSIQVLPPLVVHNEDNTYTGELARILEGDLRPATTGCSADP